MSLPKNQYLAQTIVKLFYAFAYEIDTITDGSTNKSKVVTFNTGKDWKEIYFTPASANYSEPGKETDAGTMYEQKLTAFHPGEDAENPYDFEYFIARPLVLKIVYSSGQMKLLGNKTNYVELSDNFNVSGKTGRTLDFIIQDYQKAFWLEEV